MLDRVLSLLQLTRMALVFTAIADAQAALALSGQWAPAAAGWAGLMSLGLYGFGMALNDIIDARRDQMLAPGRPLPSGRVRPWVAHVIAGLLLGAGLLGAWRLDVALDRGFATLAVAGVAAGLIAFYDVAGKYLVPVGLVALGLVRFTHATAADPGLTIVAHPLALLNFVTLLSAAAYALEEKRPPLRAGHWIVTVLLLIGCNAIVLNRTGIDGPWAPGAALLAAAAGFGVVAAILASRTSDRRELGRRLMLWGLLWLIVFDAAAVATRDWRAALGILALLPIAWGGVRLIRAWAAVNELRRPAEYLRE
jgi:4-hydroxybenzoate polyprenyltransferase